MVKILEKDDKILRQISSPVSLEDFGSDKLKNIIDDMTQALDSQEDGLAIAAPQIGISKRIFIVSGRIKDNDFMTGKFTKNKKYPPNLIFINPEIIKTSKKTVIKQGEGCLSVRWIYGSVKRFSTVKIKYLDENGEEKIQSAFGILSHIFQHEIDHLDGILFIDKAKKLEEIPVDAINKQDKINEQSI